MSHPYPGLIAGGDISPCRFVKGGSSAYTVVQAGAGAPCIGFSREFVYDAPTDGASGLAASDGKIIDIIRTGQLGELEVGEAVLAWAYLKPNSVGRGVNALPGEPFSARAYEAQATATNRALCEAVQGVAPVLIGTQAKTADYTVVALTDNASSFSTDGAAGAVTFALPAATVGQRYRFRVGATQELRIDPNGTETIALPSTGVQGAAGKYLTADANGETVAIECTKTGQWSVFGFTGTWTSEA